MASAAKYKAALRTQTRRRAVPHEVNFLNITAMMDMMTIILVFLLKSLSTSPSNLPTSSDLVLPNSLLAEGLSTEGIKILVSADTIMVGERAPLKNVVVPSCFNSTSECPLDSDKKYKLCFCTGDSAHGFAPQYKAKGTTQDLLIQDLFSALENPVKIAEADASKKPKDANGNPAQVEALVLFDRYTSYRVMTEVMYTLGQAKVSKFHFLAQQGK